MIKNYFKIAWRNLFRNKTISIINILGLSLGLAFTLLVSGYVRKELLVNQSLKNIDHQYLIQSRWKEANMGPEITTFAPLALELKQNYPHLVANYYRWDGITSTVSNDQKHFREEIQIGDTSFLSMFGFKLLAGNENSAFSDPSSVVISSSAALRYFGSTDVIGKSLTIENFSGDKKDFNVTGVLDEIGYNSVTNLTSNDKAQIYLPLSAIEYFDRAQMDNWYNHVIVSYIELQNNAQIPEVEKAAKLLIEQNADEFAVSNVTAFLTPLKKYHLGANDGIIKKMISTLSLIALFILVMAVINFVNISIGRSTSRTREIGVRKVLGGVKKQLVIQFLTESVLIVFLSAFFSLFIYQAAKGLFAEILGKNLPDLNEFPSEYTLWFILFVMVIGVLAGLFPAFVLSSFKTVDSLKGKLNSVRENLLSKKLLVGFQFSLATFVLIGMFVISKQISLFFSDELGYKKDFVISVTTPRDWSRHGVERMKVVRNELAALPFVSGVSISYAIPNGRTGGSGQFKTPGQNSPVITALGIETDSEYADTYGITLSQGSFLEDTDDSTAIVINETAAKNLGWLHTHDAIGKKIGPPGMESLYTVKGVTKDFHFGSMKEAIKPIAFVNVNSQTRYRFMSFKIKQGSISENIQALHAKWNELLAGAPFEYKFMDDTLAELYKTEIQLEKSAYLSAVLSIIIVLLGVLGLVSISIQKRIKEIGIRKVLGSSVKGIVSLFIKEFLVVVLVAGVFACPLAYYIFRNWLNNYAYRINLTVEPFIFSILFLSVVTLLLIVVQTMKAAVTNPVKSLRTE